MSSSKERCFFFSGIRYSKNLLLFKLSEYILHDQWHFLCFPIYYRAVENENLGIER